jgi:hypothetical protein
MRDFLRLKPPTFAGSSNPLDADDWLRMIKRKLEAIRCPENQRVHLAAHQLSRMALSWWDSFSAVVRDATWVEFEAAFQEHHVPQGIVQLKEDEFRELTQGGRSVSEYVHKFTELALGSLLFWCSGRQHRSQEDGPLLERAKTRTQDYPCQPRFPQLLAPLKQGHTSGKGKGRRKRSPQEEIPSPPSSAARQAPENSILWVSTQGTKLQ